MTGISLFLRTSRRRNFGRAFFLTSAAVGLAACEDGAQFPFGQARLAAEPEAEAAAPANSSASADAVSRDVEAPEVFYTSETGLWDGRPSLGGVWVAHPDVTEPERVLIRNAANGQTITGALFRRERDNPGPSLMVSSDAAAAINVIAGQPTDLEIVALRPEPEPELNIQVPPPDPAEDAENLPEDDTEAPIAVAATGAAVAESTLTAAAEVADDAVDGTTDISAIATAALDDVEAEDGPELDPEELAAAVVTRAETGQSAIPEAAMSSQVVLAATQPAIEPLADAAEIATDAAGDTGFEVSALDAAEVPSEDTAAQEEPAAAAPEAPAPQTSENATQTLDRPFIQVGVFTAQSNAETADQQLRGAGMIPTTNIETGSNGDYWRLTVGPAQNSEERAALLDSVRGLGFEDAYFVTN